MLIDQIQDLTPQVELARLYPAPPEKVWRVWTEPELLRAWWKQGRAPGWRAEFDVRVGGRWRVVARDPDGEYRALHGFFRQVVPARRLVFTWQAPGMPAVLESLVTLALRPLRGGTELELALAPVFDARIHRRWRGALERLDLLLQKI